jgi:aminotransferase EvaB
MTRILINDLGRQLGDDLSSIETAVLTTLRTGQFVLGSKVHEFETAFANYCGVGHAVGVGNGTDALEIAMRALDVGPGDRVLTVANAGGYANSAIRACGARPCFVDVDESTMQLNVDAFAKALESKPRVAIVTHLFGLLAPMNELILMAEKAGVTLIEDCAQAHGARLGSRLAGAFGLMGCFSFYPTKNLGALGDGGAVITGDAKLAEKLRSLRQYGWNRKYHVTQSGGRNSRLDEIQAAILLARLPSLNDNNTRRREIAAAYWHGISHPLIRVPDRRGESDVVHLMVILCKRRAALVEHLDSLDIASDIHYPLPDHRQPAYFDGDISLPVTEKLANEILTLPCHPAMTDAEVQRVIDSCNGFPNHDA